MESPRCRVFIRGMSDASLEPILRELQLPRNRNRLLRHLGLPHAPARLRLPAALNDAVVRLYGTRHTSLAAYVLLVRGSLDVAVVRTVAARLRAADDAAHQIVIALDDRQRRVVIGCDVFGSGLRHIELDCSALRASELEVLAEMGAADGDTGTAIALRLQHAFDRSRITDRFFRDMVAVRDVVARHWIGLPVAARAERDVLALLLLSRLLFLCFLQRRRVLNGDVRYLLKLLQGWRSTRHATSFYRTRLCTLFFGVLNRRPEQRTARARALGTLPYLNGGLFEQHRLELAHTDLDLGDDVVARVFDDLLERYRFTTVDAGEHGARLTDTLGVDPELLGRMFEGLMPGERRERTGTFYTPATVVDRVVTAALAEHLGERCALPVDTVQRLLEGGSPDLPDGAEERLHAAARELRVLDPACGSGAFLLGALAQIGTLRARLEGCRFGASQFGASRFGESGRLTMSAILCTPGGSVDIRRDIVARTLHGVDLLEDAALICSLRLWLALVPECDDGAGVPPLPNLDRRVRQGDALIDPLDIGDAIAGRPLDTTAPPELRPLLAALEPAGARYLGAGPEERPALRRELARLERALAGVWLATLERRLAWEERELTARGADTDLFGQPASHAATALKRLSSVRQRRQELDASRQNAGGRGCLPFFSFRVHFAEAAAGFDLILSNPPWVRAHRWPPTVRKLLRERFQVCARAGWPHAARLAGMPAAAGAQVDLSLLFLERSVRLLAEHGTLGMLLPAKLFRSLYAGGARELLSRHMRIARIEDHGLDHRGLFDADAFTAVVVARRAGAAESAASAAAAAMVRVTMTRCGLPPLQFDVSQHELPLLPGDEQAPWLLAPTACRAVLRTMQRAGTPLGEACVIRRGAMTGANQVLVVRQVEPKLGDIARIRTEGYYRAVTDRGRAAYSGWVEGSALRRALRGADVAAWHARPSRHLLWTPRNDDPAATAPPRLRRFLQRHAGRLKQSADELGALHRLSPHTLGHKVVWSDLATDLRAAAVPLSVRTAVGLDAPLVPLNTVYFIAAASDREALLLSAYLNSLPVRVFARTIAERAKDGHFRFFAWTVGILPVPRQWRAGPTADRLTDIARRARAGGGIDAAERAELDALVAAGYGIDRAGMTALAEFDAWLAGGA
jgi:hypothetical protein